MTLHFPHSKKAMVLTVVFKSLYLAGWLSLLLISFASMLPLPQSAPVTLPFLLLLSKVSSLSLKSLIKCHNLNFMTPSPYIHPDHSLFCSFSSYFLIYLFYAFIFYLPHLHRIETPQRQRFHLFCSLVCPRKMFIT